MRVVLVTLGDPQTLTGGYLYHRRMAEAAPAHDAALEFVSFPRAPFPTPVLAARRLLRRVRASAPDVVVLDSIVAWAAAPWGRDLPAPAAAMIHQPPGGIDTAGLRRSLQARLDLAAYRAVPLLMVASASLRDLFSRRAAPGRRVEVVPPGRDVAEPDAAVARDDLRRGRRAAFLCVGNWLPRKGISELVEAFAALEPGVATLHLVGDPSVDSRYEAHVRAALRPLEAAGRAVVHGPVTKERVAALYRAADAFVLPSVVEPYGTVYGEAMASGLPVVGWRAGNLPYLAQHGREGLVVDSGDVAALTAALDRLARDDDLRRGLARGAAARAADLPTWEETAARFFSCLRSLLGEHPPGPRGR